MFQRKHILVIQLITIVLAGVLVSQQAFAVQSWQRRPKKADSSMTVSKDLSGEGAAIEAARNHISANGNEIVETTQAFDFWIPGQVAKSGPTKFTLEECVSRALERNMRLKAASKDVEAAEGQLTEAKAAYWPVMEYKYRMGPVPTDVDDAWGKFWAGDVTFFNSIHVGIGIPVLTFGQLHMVKELAKGGVQAARIKGRQAAGEVIFQVKKVYYGIQLAHESIKLLKEAIAKMDKKIESGGEGEYDEFEEEEDELEDVNTSLDPYDALQLRAFKAELERRLLQAEQNIELAFDAMRMLLDLEPGANVELDSGKLKPKLASLDKEEEFIDGGMRHQHEVKLLDIGVETRRRQYKLEKFKLFPRAGFGFFVDVGRSAGEIRGLQLTDDYNDPFNYTRAGIGLQIKGTIDIHGSYGRIKKARAEYHKAVYERMIARRALSTDIRKAYLEAKRAKVDVARTRKELSIANQMMFLSKVNIDIGLGESNRYADALKYMLLSRGRYFKAVFDYNMALAGLEKRIGRERYGSYVPTPNIDEMDAFEYNGDGEDEDGGWITLDGGGDDDTYGVQTEDGGVTDGSVEE